MWGQCFRNGKAELDLRKIRAVDSSNALGPYDLWNFLHE